MTINNANIVSELNNENNPALKNFNKDKVTTNKKSNTKIQKSSQKFPMPRNYQPNMYPDRMMTPLELTREMVDYYDNKNKPKEYQDFINKTLNYKKKDKKPKKTKTIKEKEEATQEYEMTGESDEQSFEEIKNFHFALCNNVIKPNRSGNFLPYLRGNIGIENMEIIMLKDCGATHSLLDINEFKKLKGSRSMKIKTMKLKMVTPNATTENAIQGEVELDMNMEDITGNMLHFKKKFLLADLGGKQKCILGYDFLSREDIIIGETPRHIFLKSNGKSHAIEILKCNMNFKQACPIATNKKEINIEANSVQMIELTCESEFKEITSLENKECTFNPKTLSDNHETYGLTLEPTLSIPTKTSDKSITFFTIIANTNNTEMTLKAGTILGSIEDISQNEKIKVSEKDFRTLTNTVVLSGNETAKNINFTKEEGCNIHTFNFEEDSVSVNSIFNRKEKIEKDTEMEDGSTRTQLTSNIEDMLECETYIDPNELLDKEENLDITMADFTSVPEELKDKLMDIVGNELKDIWSKHKWDIGKTQRLQHEIKTKPGVTVKDKKRPIPFQRQIYANKAVNTLMKYKLVTPAYNSKWATNLVLVQKPAEGALRDSTKASKILNRHKNNKCTWRLTQDLRSVNKATTNIYKANLPTIDEIINKCRNKVVTQVDINQAYFTIGLSEESKEKTSFYLNDMMYYWEVMTQGLAGAPHTWTKFMQLIFCDETLKEYRETFPERGKLIKEKHWSDFLSVYMDDLDIFSNTTEDNLNHTHAVLYILMKEGCKLNPKKAKFMTTNFTTLGISINTKENSVSIDKKKAQAILSWPKPSSLLEVMSRIQSLNYLSKNLPKLKEIAYPLMTLLREKVFRWEKEHQTAWEHLKQLIRLDIRLTIPDETMEYVTSSDTSKIAVAGNLWNYDPKTGKLYLLGCMSKLLSVSDSLKPPFHKECLAMCLNLKTWESYILGTENRITALCDARGVMWLHRNKEFSNALTRISLYLSQFRNLVIWHIPGTQNQLADIFSRSYHGSAYKTKEDFKLSKTQAQHLPPLTNPCMLEPDELFRIFTSLPETEPDHDRGNKKRRPLPMPKPIINIMKELEDTTPEEKFISARRILEGWNDKTLSEENEAKKMELNSIELEIEKEYIKELAYKAENKEVTLEEKWIEKLEKIQNNEITGLEKVAALNDISLSIPQKKQEEIVKNVKKQVLESEKGKNKLEKINPTSYKVGDKIIRNPEGSQNLTKTEQSMDKAEEAENNAKQVAISVLETIAEEKNKENEHSPRTKERMLATLADLFENKGKLTAETLIKLQKSDNFCARTRKLIEKKKDQPSFKILNDILVKLEFDTQRQKHIVKIVLPDDIMPMVCQQIHKENTIHLPRTGCLQQLRKCFYNKNAATHIQNIIDSCTLCMYTHKPSGKPTPGPGQRRTIQMENIKAREAIAIDLATNLPTTKGNHGHALTVVDLKTNYGQIYAIKSKTASEVTRALEHGWIKHLGSPRYLYSDMGLEFTGEVKTLCLKYGITQYTTFPHSHQGNRAELLVKAFKNNTRKLVHDIANGEEKAEWDTLLPTMVTKLNKSIIYLTKSLTREILMFGDEIKGPSLEIEPNGEKKNYFELRDTTKETCLMEYDKLRQNNKKYYKPPEEMTINEKDLIYIKNRKEVYPKSLKVQYMGPIRVTKTFAKGITGYHVLTGAEMSAHYNHIKKITANQFEEEMPKKWQEDLKKHILSIERTKNTKRLDYIFEEDEQDNQI